MEIGVIKKFVESQTRIPLEFRKEKEKALSLINFIKQNNLTINNPDVFSLASWVGVSLEGFKPSDITSQVKNVKLLGKQPTYDLSIKNGKSYVVNGIIAHNTTNLPETATKEEMSKIYLLAHETGCKGITTYRDKCRDGVLISSEKNQSVIDNHAPKRPETLTCDIYHSQVISKITKQVEKWIFFIGLLNDRPYEIFGGKKENIDIPKKITSGWMKKNKKKNTNGFSTYDLYLSSVEESPDRTVVKDIVSQFKPDEGMMTRLVSANLRHGIPIHVAVEILGKDPESQMFAIEKCMARILKHYIKDGVKANTSETCPCCKSHLVYRDGCVTCSRENDPICSWGKCG